MPMVVSPSVEVAAYIIHALRERTVQSRRNGIVVPDGIADIERALALSVSAGHNGTAPAGPAKTEQIEVMKPRLIRYETAAELLDISVRTLKRRIAAGDLHPISIGDTPRIRVVELDQYIAALTATQEAS
jgi:excisionase family DNA binding protein